MRIPKKAGSLREQSFREIWESSPLMLDLREKRHQLVEECASCDRLHYCNRCPGIAYLENGDIAAVNSQTCMAAGIRKEEITAALKKGKI